MEEQLYKQISDRRNICNRKDELLDRINANEDNRQGRNMPVTDPDCFVVYDVSNGDEEWSSKWMNYMDK